MMVSTIAENELEREYLRASQKVSELKGFNKIRIPDHAPILDAHFAEGLVNFVDLLNALIQ